MRKIILAALAILWLWASAAPAQDLLARITPSHSE